MKQTERAKIKKGLDRHILDDVDVEYVVQYSDFVYMLENNRVMKASNEDWFHVNRFIRAASPKGSSQDRISEADRIAGLDRPACVLDRIVLPGACVLRKLENFGRGFHPEMEGDEIINKCTLLLPRKTPRTPLLFVCRQIVCCCFYVAVNRL